MFIYLNFNLERGLSGSDEYYNSELLPNWREILIERMSDEFNESLVSEEEDIEEFFLIIRFLKVVY